jgi:hypothetical protein
LDPVKSPKKSLALKRLAFSKKFSIEQEAKKPVSCKLRYHCKKARKVAQVTSQICVAINNAPASMAGAEEHQAEGTVAALEVAMVPGQDALGVVDMTTPKASLIEVHQQLGPEVQKLHDREDGAAAEQQPQSGNVALAEQARHDVGGGEGGGVKHGAMKGKGGGKAAEVTEAEVARAAEEEAAATKLAAEEAEAAATKLAAEEVEAARAAEWWIHPTFRNRGIAYNSRSFA